MREEAAAVASTGNGLACTCEAHIEHGSDCEHILTKLEAIKRAGGGFKMMERSKFKICKYCKSGKLVKAGIRKNKNSTQQMYRCRGCGKKLSLNCGFENKRYDPVVITRSLQMYFSGQSFRDISATMKMEGIMVSHVTIYGWVVSYSKLVTPYLDGIIPHVGSWFRADEVYVRMAGKMAYFFNSMDDETRFWLAGEIAETKNKHNADNLLDMTKKQAGKIPSVFISDKLPAYAKSCRKMFGRRTYHKSDAGIRSKRKNRYGKATGANFHPSNNKMERLNGEIRDREKVFRGLKKPDTEILNGMRVYYNFAKKHGALDGKTPAEAADIKIEGTNKWKTIIQNAAVSQARP